MVLLSVRNVFKQDTGLSSARMREFYVTRPSRTQQLKNPKLRMKHSLPYDLDHPDAKEEKGKLSKKSKRSIDQILILAVIVRLQFSRVIVGLLP